MVRFKGKVLLAVFCMLCFASMAQLPNDTIFGRDTSIVDIYQPKATFDNFKLLKQESGSFGIGSNFACQSYYGLMHMCELPPYVVGGANYNNRWSNVQYKISGGDSSRANLILITAELHNPDYSMKTLDVFVDVIRKTLNMLGETMPDGLKSAIVSMNEYKIRTPAAF
ncbi:MAG: hypothetical protein M0D57_18510 [Sphingobacteriales bacterium JAD_PAG50586_3]|nr:MAG: hypothetical protein M0D57_18510 [Sphingobacteriales bacterium JAD_PAG50586_3]